MSMTKEERRARYERRTAYHTEASERRVRRLARQAAVLRGALDDFAYEPPAASADGNAH